MCTTYLSSHLPTISRQTRSQRRDDADEVDDEEDEDEEEDEDDEEDDRAEVARPPQDKAPVCTKKFLAQGSLGCQQSGGAANDRRRKSITGRKTCRCCFLQTR